VNPKVKWLVGITGALLLGALGSGLWEYVLQPAFGWAGSAALDVGTLGLERYKDGVYQEIARGNPQNISVFLLSLTIFLFVAFLGVVTGFVAGVRQFRKESLSEEGEIATPSRTTFRIGVAAIVFAAGWMAISSARAGYVNRAQVHYEQLLATTAPHMATEERVGSRSAFAQIQSREDFITVLSTLNEIAHKNRLEIPEFEVW
jgi:hypothetical protein